MKRIFIFLIQTSICVSLFAENINFYSGSFELAVKDQLGLDEKEFITRDIADTITILKLSAYGLDDLRDVVYFPHLQYLDIAYNNINDLFPLINLEYLRYLNVRGNKLRSVDVLAFSESSEMVVNVSGNYIKDYELTLNNPRCIFTIIGLNYQKSPYIINHFYTDFDLKTTQKNINCNIWTLSEFDSLYLKYDKKSELIKEVGVDIQINKNITGNVVYLSLDEQVVDTAYFILPTSLRIEKDSTVITPSFPNNYKLLSIESSNSHASISNNSIFFRIAKNNTSDTIRIGFGKNLYDIRGYTYYYIKSDGTTGSEPVTEREKLIFYPNPVDNILTVRVPDQDGSEASISLISLTGQIVYQAVTNESTYQIDVRNLSEGIYVLSVKTAKENYIEKIIKK